MPTAADSLRKTMGEWFGDEIDLAGPKQFLEGHGYTFDDRGYIIAPKKHRVTDQEHQCICFLCDEWDFGWNGNLQNGSMNPK